MRGHSLQHRAVTTLDGALLYYLGVSGNTPQAISSDARDRDSPFPQNVLTADRIFSNLSVAKRI
jgi:hypothetical protein